MNYDLVTRILDLMECKCGHRHINFASECYQCNCHMTTFANNKVSTRKLRILFSSLYKLSTSFPYKNVERLLLSYPDYKFNSKYRAYLDFDSYIHVLFQNTPESYNYNIVSLIAYLIEKEIITFDIVDDLFDLTSIRSLNFSGLMFQKVESDGETKIIEAIENSILSFNDSAVFQLAKTIYNNGQSETMPILADALEEAGLTDTNILKHCRNGKQHYKGCWVLDTILGRL